MNSINKKIIMKGFLFTIIFTLLVIGACIPMDLSIVKDIDPTRYIYSGLLLFAIVGFYSINTSDNKKEIARKELGMILLSVLVSLVIGLTIYYKGYLDNYIKEVNLERLEALDSNYPNSTDIADIKSLISNLDYKKIDRFDSDRFKYIDPFDMAIQIKRYNYPALTYLFNKAMKDNYLNVAEEKELNVVIKEYLIEKTRA